MKNINKYKDLQPKQKEIRLSIMDLIIEKERPVKLNEVYEHLEKVADVDLNCIKDCIDLFVNKNIMVVDNEEVNYIYPVSAHKTMHQVKLNDGREFSAMCAIDALGTACTFGQDIKITSMCNVTGKEINICVKKSKIHSTNNDDLRILHINLDKYENWATSC